MTTPDDRKIKGHFTAEEEAVIRESIVNEIAPLRCPRCDQALKSTLPLGGRCSKHEVWELHCEICLQSITIENDLNI